jgi:UDP-N-acetylmuramoyl-tripeptide--D-alanyl-D-alanine ligase
MSLWNLGTIAQHLGASLTDGEAVVPSSLSMDTRTLQRGACFVAIRAQRDGHEFAARAVELGAAALLVDHGLSLDVPQLIVADTLGALQRWGQARLECFRPRSVFGVTGSVGKTSTKDLLAAATGGWKTPGNRNNTLGLPEALATLPGDLQAVVLEMGMSTPGEIRRLTEIAPLDHGLITTIGTAHIEFFPLGQEGIARAKGELVEGLRPGGTWVHLASDAWCRWIALQSWARHARAVAVGDGHLFGWEAAESLGPRGERFRLRTPQGPLDIQLKLRGAHHVRNAALAAVCAIHAGHDPAQVAEGMNAVEPGKGRGRLHALEGGGWLLDESYNASPDSILACAASLLELDGGEPVAVLGCMREQGGEAERLHRETGEGLRQAGLTRVWIYGDHAGALTQGFGKGARAFPDFEALRTDPEGLSALPEGARILVKGSLFWQAERAVQWILEQRGGLKPVRSAEILG